MKTKLSFCIVLYFLFSDRACAMKDDTVPADMAVIEKVWGDAQTLGLKRGREIEVARRAEAEKKTEALRTIPPERVQDWINGKLSEEELEKVVSLAQIAPAKIDMTRPSPRVSSFTVLSVTTLVLAFLYGVQRRRTQTASIQKGKDQSLRESANIDGKHPTWTIK